MHKITPTLCLVVLLLTAGCVYSDPGRGRDLSFSGTMRANGSEFTMKGTFGVSTDTSAIGSYPNVTVYLLSKEKNVIYEKDVGTLDGTLNISIQTSNVPYYVVIDSPSFWTKDGIRVAYYTKMENGRYRTHFASSHEELPQKSVGRETHEVVLSLSQVVRVQEHLSSQAL